jgi:hypothetical protein
LKAKKWTVFVVLLPTATSLIPISNFKLFKYAYRFLPRSERIPANFQEQDHVTAHPGDAHFSDVAAFFCGQLRGKRPENQHYRP